MFGFSRKKKKDVNADHFADWRLRERWEDYPTPNYDDTHTYCSISFDGSENTFYYRTRNPDIRIGDMVYVPVGRSYEKKIGRVVGMMECTGDDIPYPLERTKYISGKVDGK